jgi:hypothetical protein
VSDLNEEQRSEHFKALLQAWSHATATLLAVGVTRHDLQGVFDSTNAFVADPLYMSIQEREAKQEAIYNGELASGIFQVEHIAESRRKWIKNPMPE